MITSEQLENWFTHHPPTGPSQLEAYQRIRQAGHEFAKVLVECTPASDDQLAAIRHVRDAVMTANCSIACTHHWK